MLSHYRIEEKIYQSAFSEVFQATYLPKNIEVALKVITPEKQGFREIFFKEVEISKKLSHSPYFVPFFEAFEENERFYLCTRFIRGKSLLECEKNTELLFSLLKQASEALKTLHETGVIHCDINPRNMVITHENQLCFLDFGIAHSAGTNSAVNAGTLPYMPPEQLGYISYPAGPYSDFYSLGVSFYQAFSGKLPFFDLDQTRLIHQILTEKPESLCLLNPATPPLINAVILKLLQKNPEDRYQSAKGLIYDLETLPLNLSENEIVLGEKDRAGNLRTEFEPIGIENLLAQMSKKIERGLNPIIRADDGSGKSRVLKAFFHQKKEVAVFLASPKPEESRNAGSFLLRLMRESFFSSEILKQLPETEQNAFHQILENFSNFKVEDLKNTLKMLFAGLFEILKAQKKIMVLDNLHESDVFSQEILLKAPGGILAASVNRSINADELPPALSLMDLLPFDGPLLKRFFSEVFQNKMPETGLELLSLKFLKYSFYPGEIFEKLQILFQKKIIEFSVALQHWKVNDEALEKIDFKSFYQDYLKNRLAQMKPLEILFLKILCIARPPYEIEFLANTLSLAAKIPEEQAFDRCIDMMADMKEQGLLKIQEGNELSLPDLIRQTLISEMSLQEKSGLYEAMIQSLLPQKELYLKPLTLLMKESGHPQTALYLSKLMKEEYEKKNFSESSLYYLWVFDALQDDLEFLKHFTLFARYRFSFTNLAPMVSIVARVENLLSVIPLSEHTRMNTLLSLNYYYFMQNNFSRSLTLIQTLLPLAEKHQNLPAVYFCYSGLGAIYFFSSRVSEAETALKKGMALLEKLKSKEKESYNYGLLALSQAILGKKQEALENGKKSVALSRKCPLAEQATCLHFAGYTHSHFGLFKEGLDFSLEALEIASKLENPLLAYSANFSAALGYVMKEDFIEAENHLNRSLEFSKKMNVMVGLDWVYHILLELHFRTLNREQFEENFNQLKKLKPLFQHSLTYQLTFLKYQGISYLFYHDYPSAQEILQQALTHARNENIMNRVEEARILGLLSFTAREMGEYETGEGYAAKSEKIFDEYEMPSEKSLYLARNPFSSKIQSTSRAMTSIASSDSRSYKESMAYESVLRAAAIINSILDPEKLLNKLMEILFQTFGAEKGYLKIQLGDFKYARAADEKLIPLSEEFVIQSLIHLAEDEKTPLILKNASKEYSEKKDEKSVLVFPVIHRAKTMGMLYLANSSLEGVFSSQDLKPLSALMTQTSIAIENAVHFINEKEARRKAEATLKAFQLFVPPQFMNVIAGEGIEKIRLGNAREKKVSIFFSDIRDFTAISENMTPEDLMIFLNSYMEAMMGENISRNAGFIDKFIGDAVMAVFDDEHSDGALKAAEEIQKSLIFYNELLKDENPPRIIRTGIGINTGRVIMGTVGTHDRMDSTIIGDEVNLASRLEGLTKLYQIPIIVSASAIKNLKNPDQFLFREIDSVSVKGKAVPVTIYELFSWQNEAAQALKSSYESDFLMGITFYKIRQFEEALQNFQRCLNENPEDSVVKLYLKRCQNYIQNPPDEDWDGSVKLDQK